MKALHDFTGIEFDWIACDADGFIGYFSTAGAGPVPEDVLGRAVELEDIFDKVLDLVVTSKVDVRLNVDHNISEWIEIARRGIFAYDWCREEECYRLIALPLTPTRVGSPADFEIAQLYLIESIRFSSEDRIVVG